jgi:hypothetical protein
LICQASFDIIVVSTDWITMSRLERRAVSKELAKLQRKAKEDMLKWAMSLEHDPSKEEGEAWKAGYLAGINRNTLSK